MSAAEVDLERLPAMLKVPEVARLLRIGRNQTYASIDAGEIRAVRIGRSIRIPRAELARLLGLQPSKGGGASAT